MENLGIDWKLLVAQAINFALFFFIFKKFLAKPFSNFIHEERKNEAERQKLAEETRKGAEELEKKELEVLNKARKEADEIVLSARESAETLKKETLEETNNEVLRLKERNKKQLEEEKGTLYRDAREKVFDLALLMVNKALKDVLSVDVRKKVTENILKNSNTKISSL